MAFPIMELDYPNVKRTPPPIPPYYHLGLIPAGHALRRVEHYLYPEGKAVATQKFTEWSSQNSFLEGKIYLDLSCHTVIVTAFFLEVLPPHTSCWEGQTYIEVGEYPYLSSPRDILRTIFRHSLDELTNDTARQDTKAAWQQTDITGSLIELSQLVEAADQIESAKANEKQQLPSPTCEQRFTEKQLTTLAQALYRVPYSVRRYTKRGEWDSVSWVYYLEPDTLPPLGKRFVLEAHHHDTPSPWYRPPCTFLTVVTKYSFAEPVEQRTMTTLWNAAHTPTKKLPKLLQKGISRRAQ